MRWIFLAPFVVLCSFCLGQVPGHVPQDGLVAWYPFNGNADDESGNGNNGVAIAAELTGDRAGNSNSAYFFNGLNSFIDISTVNSNQLPLSISVWFRTDAVGEMSIIDSDNAGQFGHSVILAYDPSGTNPPVDNQNIFIQYHNGTIDTDYMNPVDEWTHLALNLNLNYAELFINGSLHGEYFPSMASTLDGSGFRVGKHNDYDPQWFHGSIDDIAIYERTLSASEILILAQPTLGCTNESACNYDPEANSDDNSCEYVSCHCLDGTIWSDELGGCIPATTCPQDLDYDGVVGVNDLMNLLSAFGTPCDPPVPEWTCGNPVSYHGYDYETVLIGEQCWFAENSRFIPSVSPASDYSMSEPRCHVYGYNGSAVEEALLTAEYGVYGALYNFQAVQQWEICPTGWHVPSDEDWMELELTLGIPADSLDVVGYRGCNIGDQLKSESLWNGTNQSGMNMLPGGGTVDSGEFVFLEERGWFWSSTEAPQQAAWFRQLESNQNGIYRAHWNQNQEGGKSIRCIKD